jgi:hypothetical protein
MRRRPRSRTEAGDGEDEDLHEREPGEDGTEPHDAPEATDAALALADGEPDRKERRDEQPGDQPPVPRCRANSARW